MKIAIDLDNTITEYPEFFRVLCNLFCNGHEVFIITNRDPNSAAEVKAELAGLGITYHRLIITAQKATAIMEHGITVFFDDTDEYFLELPPEVCVLKVREPGNFDFDRKRWIYGDQTGYRIG